VITVEDVLTTCGKHPERMRWVSPAIEQNAAETAKRVSALLLLFGESRTLTSGFRDPETNRKTKGSAPNSRHLTGQAADIDDWKGDLKAWALKNPDAVANCGLWCEPLHLTATWLHVQTVPGPGGLRVPQ
jgi:hypothetical protein